MEIKITAETLKMLIAGGFSRIELPDMLYVLDMDEMTDTELYTAICEGLRLKGIKAKISLQPGILRSADL